MIVPADTSDGNLLTELALTSKAFWGYDKNLIESWRNDLTVTTEMITERKVFKFIVENKIAGFYMLNLPKEKSIELEMLFVLPEFIGNQIGKQLLHHSFKEAIKLNVKTMTLLSDPNAKNFYETQGFTVIDKKESSIKGRFLPIMRKLI